MSIEQFASLTEQLISAYGPFIQVWLILFVVGGVSLAIFVPFMIMGKRWLENF
jgi:hypothetical protein